MENKNRTKIHRINKTLVLKNIILHSPLSRVELSKYTNLSKMSITNYVNMLIESGDIEETGTMTSESGRKPIMLDVVKTRPLLAAIQVTRHYTSVGIVNLKGTILRINMSFLEANETPSSLLSKIHSMLDNLITPDIADDIWAIGASSMGPVSNKIGRLNTADYSFNDSLSFDIRNSLQERYRYPVYVNNDLNTLALAEKYFGNAKDYGTFAVVGSSIGLGCGIVVDNQLYSGGGGYGAELGHITVEANGLECYCGNKGCLELYATIPKIIEWLQNEFRNNNKTCHYNNWQDLLDGARHGDALCLKAVDRLVDYLSAGLVSLVNLFDPECIFLGEDYCQAYDLLAARLTESLNRRKFFSKNTIVPVQASKFMGAAPLVSPAAYAMHMILQENSLPW